MKDSLINQYFNYVEQYTEEYGEKTLVLIQVGAFFEVYGKSHKDYPGYHGSAIQEFSKFCDLKIAPKTKVKAKHIFKNDNGENVEISCNVFMAGFRDFLIEKYLEKIEQMGYTSVVYKQNDITPSAPRELLGIFSPGTYFNQSNQRLTNNIMCIYVHYQGTSMFCPIPRLYYGISCIDVLTGDTNIYDQSEKFYKTYQSFNEIEKLANVFSPNEVLILYTGSDNENVSGVISNLSELFSKFTQTIRRIDLSDKEHILSKRAVNCTKQNYQHEIMKQYYQAVYGNYEEICNKIQEYPCMMNSFAFLLDYINKQNSDLIQKMTFPKINNDTELLFTENHSLTQLNIIDDGKNKSKYSSLTKFLNQCVTNMGKRAMKKILSAPKTVTTYLNDEYNKVEFFKTHYEFSKELQKSLSNVNDLESFYRKLSLKKITPYEMSMLHDDLCLTNDIMRRAKQYDEIKDLKMYSDKDVRTSMKTLKTFMDENLDMKICKKIGQESFEVNFFRKGLYPEIDDVERKFIESYDILETLQTYFTDLVKNTEKKSKTGDYCKIHKTEKSGLMLKMTDTRSKKLIEQLKKEGEEVELEFISSYTKETEIYTLKTTDISKSKQGSETILVSSQINQITRSIESYKNQLKDMLKIKFAEFIAELFNFHNEFRVIIDFFIEFDVVVNKGMLASHFNYCRPEIDDDCDHSYVDIREMRHPLIEHLNKDEIYVAHDISLGKEEKVEVNEDENYEDAQTASTNGILLFGTNAVGKSSLMKALGMCVIMAQCGFFVPCKIFKYKPYKKIFTRILSNDNIFKGLSTFAVEMSELRNIIDNADKNSLIIGDELCSGTELGSAISIFVATLTQLHERNSTFIFATHFHEVTKMNQVISLDKLKMKHLSVYYDARKDVLVYDRILKDGPGNNSYGLEVCKAMGLRTDFIDLAMDIRGNYVESGEKNISEMSASHFNKDIIVGKCELCQIKSASEVHHLQYQKNANELNLIGYIHKNKKANLVSICEDCHNKIHKENKQLTKRKTPKGFQLE
jgi:DNA mismatch repair protein MutS